jgi:hypothetical protein
MDLLARTLAHPSDGTNCIGRILLSVTSGLDKSVVTIVSGSGDFVIEICSSESASGLQL